MKPRKPQIHGFAKRASNAIVITELDPIYLSEKLGEIANWVRLDERQKALVQRDCPTTVARTLIARKIWDFPVLTGIIQSPTLRSDGSILEIPGYDDETGLFFDPEIAVFPTIPPFPIKDDAIEALKKFLDLLSGFPFEND